MQWKVLLFIVKKTNTKRYMKKKEASKIQYDVFRRLFPRSVRQHKRRVFLSEAMKDLCDVCGYSSVMLHDIAHDIVEDLSFNLFYGVVIGNFALYCKGYQGSTRQTVDKVEITLIPASLGFFDFFSSTAEYRVNYYSGGELIHSANRKARRF